MAQYSIGAELRRCGFARSPKVFDARELASVTAETKRLIDSWSSGSHRDDVDFWSCLAGDPPVETLYRIHRFETKSAAPRVLASSPRFQRLIMEVFGVGAVPTECALTIKMPNRGVEVPWHRDPVLTPPFGVYNFSIYLDHSSIDGGCLFATPGSHLTRGQTANRMPAGALAVEADVGDVVVHDVHVEHGSPACDDPRGRRAIIIEFSAPGVRPALDDGSLTPIW